MFSIRRLSACAVAALALVLLPVAPVLAQCINLATLNVAATQDFNTLSNTAGSTTNSLTITGWFMNETGGGARDNDQYAVDTGGSNTGDTYSYGAAAAIERALGGLQSGTLIPQFGACYTNNTGATITSLTVAYTGEQWRIQNTAAARDDRLDFQFSTTATSLVTGTWTDVDALDFTNPIKTNAIAAALDGNAATNRTAISTTISSLSIPNGATFWIRWNDLNASGADDALAIDDVALTPAGAPTQPSLSVNDVSVVEGNTGTRNAVFTVSLSSPAGAGGVGFTIATADQTATATVDYVPQNLAAQTIPAGQSTYTFTVQVNGDEVVEGNETFLVVVTKITGATSDPEASTGVGTIVDDDVNTATLSIADPAPIGEGDAGTRPQNFTVSLSAPLGADVAFTASTTPGTATAADFTPQAAAPYTIVAGQTSVTVPVAIIGDLDDESAESYTLAIATSAPNVTLGQATATATINDDDDAPVEIHAIQGNGLRSPLAPATGTGNGQVVVTAGNVVTGIAANGFSMQTPDARADADPLTSQGIFVFTSTVPPASIAIGDVVTVKGAVAEFFNFTQITGAPVVVETGTGALPTAVVFDQNRPSRDPANLSCSATLGNFECFEGMLVSVPAGVVNTGNQTFGTDVFAEVFASAVGTRARREAGVRFGLTPPASPATVPVWDGNPELFELDADRMIPTNANRAIAGGSLFSAVGVIGYDFGNHELWPTSLTLVDETLPRQVPPPAMPRWLSVASFNMLRLCDTVNSAGTGTDPCLSPTPTPADLTLKVNRLSDYIRTVLRSPDVVAVQEVETWAVLQQLATAVAAQGGPTYTAYLAEGNDPGGIDVGFLVRDDRVSGASVRQLGATDQITDPAGCSTAPPCVLHDRPPYLLRGTFTGGGANFPFAVINNHLRSRNGVDTGTETARVRLKRFLQAQGVATFAQRFQSGQELVPANPTGDTATAGIPLLVVGDMNAFEVTDGWADLVGVMAGTYDNTRNELQLAANIVAPPMLQASSSIPVEERYSYVFRESLGNVQAQEPRNVSNVQIIDHALVNQIARPHFRSAHFGRTNADAPGSLQATGLGAVGVSDHDAILVYLDSEPDAVFGNGFEPALQSD